MAAVGERQGFEKDDAEANVEDWASSLALSDDTEEGNREWQGDKLDVVIRGGDP